MQTGGSGSAQFDFWWLWLYYLAKRGGKMREKVEAALAKVRPMLLADGGDVQLIDVEDGVVKLKLTGACGGCPMATMTLKGGIERVLREQVPEVKEVVAV
jgi:Fe-S cluster biogenesis protein NfuA